MPSSETRDSRSAADELLWGSHEKPAEPAAEPAVLFPWARRLRLSRECGRQSRELERHPSPVESPIPGSPKSHSPPGSPAQNRRDFESADAGERSPANSDAPRRTRRLRFSRDPLGDTFGLSDDRHHQEQVVAPTPSALATMHTSRGAATDRQTLGKPTRATSSACSIM